MSANKIETYKKMGLNEAESRMVLRWLSDLDISNNPVSDVGPELVHLVRGVMIGTLLSWRTQLKQYLADPINVEPPAFLPKKLSDYERMLDVFKELSEKAGLGSEPNKKVGLCGPISVKEVPEKLEPDQLYVLPDSYQDQLEIIQTEAAIKFEALGLTPPRFCTHQDVKQARQEAAEEIQRQRGNGNGQ